MAAAFRTAPMGFHKKDVIEYIEKLVKDQQGKVESLGDLLKEQEADSRRALQEMQEESDALRADLEGQIEEADKRASAALDEKLALEQLLRDLQAQLETERTGHLLELAEKTAELAALQAEHGLLMEKAAADHAAALEAAQAEHMAALEAVKAEGIAAMETAKSEQQAGHEQAVSDLWVEHTRVLDELRREHAQTVDELQCSLQDARDEIGSLRQHNVRLLGEVELLEQAAAALAAQPAEESKPAAGRTAQELFDAFKNRFIEISWELSNLAQGILEAEQKEKSEPAEQTDVMDTPDDTDLLAHAAGVLDADEDDGHTSIEISLDLEDEEDVEIIDCEEEPEIDDPFDADTLFGISVELSDADDLLEGFEEDGTPVRAASRRSRTIHTLLDRMRNIGEKLL